MLEVKYTWQGPAGMAEVKAIAWERIQRVVVFFWNAVQLALNVSNPRPYKTPSRPGEPPRKRTGWLQRNVLYELDKTKLEGRVGITRNALYGLYLELGTKRMGARPWLLATLEKVKAQLTALAGG